MREHVEVRTALHRSSMVLSQNPNDGEGKKEQAFPLGPWESLMEQVAFA